MTCVGRKPGRGSIEVIADCQWMLGPDRTARRIWEIAALPVVTWKGRTLRTLRCHGTSGKGPHNVNVPEALLWSLIAIDHWCCPYHAADAGWEPTQGRALPAPPRLEKSTETTTEKKI